jgi:hypothetical protein
MYVSYIFSCIVLKWLHFFKNVDVTVTWYVCMAKVFFNRSYINFREHIVKKYDAISYHIYILWHNTIWTTNLSKCFDGFSKVSSNVDYLLRANITITFLSTVTTFSEKCQTLYALFHLHKLLCFELKSRFFKI